MASKNANVEECDENIVTMLKGLDLLHLKDILGQQEVVFEDFLELTDEDLQQIGIDKLGNRRQLIRAVAEYKKETEKGK